MIPIPFLLAIALVIVGGGVWVYEKSQQAKRAVNRNRAKNALNAELSNAPTATDLPYGFGRSPSDHASEEIE
jgi:hypothetical protein